MLGLFFISLFSQTPVPDFRFEYDALGNRKLREYTTIYVKKGNYEEQKAKAGDYGIAIYPNPAISILTVNISGFKIETSASLKVFSLSGSIVMEIGSLVDVNTLDISKLTNGAYLAGLSAPPNLSTYMTPRFNGYTAWHQYLEYRAHMLDLTLTPSQLLPSRYWFESIDVLRGLSGQYGYSYGYFGPTPNTLRWWNILFNVLN